LRKNKEFNKVKESRTVEIRLFYVGIIASIIFLSISLFAERSRSFRDNNKEILLPDAIHKRLGIEKYGSGKTLSSTGDKQNVELVGRWVNGLCEAVDVSGNTAYFGNGTCMEIVDFSDPADLVKLGKMLIPEIIEGIAVSGSYAYVADGDDGLVQFFVLEFTR